MQKQAVKMNRLDEGTTSGKEFEHRLAIQNLMDASPSRRKLLRTLGIASAMAGATPTTIRMTDMPIKAATSSHGRNGLTKTWPKFRDHNSSRNEIVTPIWLRRHTSQSNTPPNSAETVTAAPVPKRRVRNVAVKPQMHMPNTGQ